jgi:carboxypeptidase Taq
MSANTQKAYKELKQIIGELTLIRSSAALLGWDEQTYMPKNGSAWRANQGAYLAGLMHEKFTAPRVGELLAELEASDLITDPLSEAAVNVRETRRDYDKLTKIPKSLVEAISHAQTIGQAIWVEARRKSDFQAFLPSFEKMIDLKKQYASALGHADLPYDALIDDFEPGFSTKSITAVFSAFRPELVELVAKIAGAPKKPNMSVLRRNYSIEKQRIFGEMAAAAVGYDLASGRIDVTAHPFCTGIAPGDCRITTRYKYDDLGESFSGILHEAGHAMYDQGLPEKSYGLPMASPVSHGIHESQSRLWENMVGRSKSFWQYFYPLAQQTFRESLGDVSFDDFYFAFNDVRPSFIRTEADEVTYNLHILLRFEIEQGIFDGSIKPADIPGIWNERFTSYFGITPANDAEGCLQDVHWSLGYFGYFPSYALGNLYAAQFFAKAKADLGNLDEQFAQGKFAPLLKWLRKNIHSQGQRHRAEELVKVVTGEPLAHRPLMDYLTAKYVPLYGA